VDIWCIDLLGGRTKYIKINMVKYHFVHHKPHMNWPAIEFGIPGRRDDV
jgi:hypothetical protein